MGKVSGSPTEEEFSEFISLVWEKGSSLYRDLPWRNTNNPFAVLVSEVMLQQTQVKRVIDYWQHFMKLFPTVDALAAAESTLVLEKWQGLGYNRRALALKKTAEICSRENNGTLPATEEELKALPGIGPATAAGIMAFAYQKPAVYLETNVRSVFLHHFFPDTEGVKDTALHPLVEKTCSCDDPRGWYYALLDYGAHLKTAGINPSRRSAHHTKQSKFDGSRRQKRAYLLRQVLDTPGISDKELYHSLCNKEQQAGRLPLNEEEFETILADLISEGFFLQPEGEDEKKFFT